MVILLLFILRWTKFADIEGIILSITPITLFTVSYVLLTEG